MKLLFTEVIGPNNLHMNELYSIIVVVETALNSRQLILLYFATSHGVDTSLEVYKQWYHPHYS